MRWHGTFSPGMLLYGRFPTCPSVQVGGPGREASVEEMNVSGLVRENGSGEGLIAVLLD